MFEYTRNELIFFWTTIIINVCIIIGVFLGVF